MKHIFSAPNGRIRMNVLFRMSAITFLVTIIAVSTSAQSTEFTFQGSLKDGANAANGNYDFEFALFDALSAGTQLGSTQQRNAVAVSNGVFSVKLDFGAQFPGGNRFLEIRVRLAGQPAYTALTPRQQISSSPYSIKSLSAVDAQTLGGIAANQYLTGTSTVFIQNTTTQQASSNFNISGNGNIGGRLRVEGLPGGALASFGGSGSFTIDAPGIVGGRLTLSESGNLGIGTASPQQTLHVNGLEILSTGLSAGFKFRDRASTSSLDDWVWYSNGNIARFFRPGLGDILGITQAGNVGIGTLSPTSKLHVFGNGGLRINADSDLNAGFGLNLNSVPKWSVATVAPGNFQIFNDAIGQNALTIDRTTNRISLGSFHDNVTEKFAVDGKVGLVLTTEPSPQFACYVRVFTPGTPTGYARLTDCGSSRRYKQNIQDLDSGLYLISRLRPVSFDWKGNGRADIGLIAEEVADVDPLLATYNDKGEVEGVKYDRIGAVAVKAIKEQQAEIESLRKEVAELKALLCTKKKKAAICKGVE